MGVLPNPLLSSRVAQDLTACQLDWFLQQHGRGLHAFFVGDMAQQIYSFRGAKSESLLAYKDAVSLKLTQSFRFGDAIALAARPDSYYYDIGSFSRSHPNSNVTFCVLNRQRGLTLARPTAAPTATAPLSLRVLFNKHCTLLWQGCCTSRVGRTTPPSTRCAT